MDYHIWSRLERKKITGQGKSSFFFKPLKERHLTERFLSSGGYDIDGTNPFRPTTAAFTGGAKQAACLSSGATITLAE
jgi:hypothetical protein